MENVEKLKNALLDIFIKQVRGGTSWENVNNLNYTWEQSQFTGIFTGLDNHYSDHHELLETIREVWDDDLIKTKVN